jgi:anti-anti-sigma factor
MTQELVDRASDNCAVSPLFAVYAESPSMLRLTGELDLAGTPALASALEPLTRRRGTIGLDLTELTFMDSSGINALCQAARRVGERGRIVVFRPTMTVRRVLEITGVVGVIAIDDHPPSPDHLD